ncbi:hypothetical protein NL108_012073 [Boleophthalmus pectinirostris]|uniref:EF-hand and coiled-coil domain-containing protein 1 n=1 Tax=Boleophthalmus pectinirostris TaxID=150288 RepID=UPI000A1C5E83|nr:EF-hand and coiled-coil domain-containing protein 1 [Boleophthalmus pectinirostris]KAJ0068836.1 hypothetical protein NL108_012073 [Boleophthalmus pectinirostris]
MERVDPSPRAVRKSEWLRSALAHHHRPDPGVDNEIVVLATGIDQYLQEVFHHLAYSHRDDTVSAEDFTALCAVLGISEATQAERDEEYMHVCAELPSQLSFKDFHARLCGYFRVRCARKGNGECAWRVPVTEDTELVERNIRLRWPRPRRKKCVSFDLTSDQFGSARAPRGTSAEQAVSISVLSADETAALRELVEDLRSALQGSDARCLALEVALRRERTRSLASSTTIKPRTPTSSSISFSQGKLVPTHRIKGGSAGAAVRRREARDPLLRELKLIRSSRDGQLQEAMKFNEQLEEELRWAYEEVRKLQALESALRKENAHIRRRAEEAREALTLGLDRVRLIQEQAYSVPQLQARVKHLETELQQHRSHCSCLTTSTQDWTHPVGADNAKVADAECLQRAVEGKAASDEEEEDRAAAEERQRCLVDMKRHCSRTRSCGKGCQSLDREASISKDRGRWSGASLSQDNKEGKAPDKTSHSGDKMQRQGMSLLEEKLTDALTLLLQLRNKNVSSQALGRIVMDTLEAYSRTGGPSQVLQVAEALCVRLSSTELQTERAEDAGTERLLPLVASHQSNSNSSLVITC